MTKGERPRSFSWRKVVLVFAWAGVAAGAFFWGRQFSPAQAADKRAKVEEAENADPALPRYNAQGASDYSSRAVAYIYDNQVITREELGEYLIARFGAERLELLVNKIIIEKTCRAKNIEVTQAEIDAALEDDLKSLSVDRERFVKEVLKHYKKSLYEWREDVIRPKLLMAKLCRARVHVTQDDLEKAFEAYYGEKVQCQMILWSVDQKRIADRRWDVIRKNPAEFDKDARTQETASLAKVGGKVDPIGRNTTGNPEMEKTIFTLEKGEVSPLMPTPEGFVVVKCLGRIPRNTIVKLEDVRAKLETEIIEKKTQMEFGVVFAELQKAAMPKLYLKKVSKDKEIRQAAEQELRYWTSKAAKGESKPPMGN